MDKVNEITYTFGPFDSTYEQMFHRSYYSKYMALMYFFPPHVKYIADFVNDDDVYFDTGVEVSVTVPMSDNLLNGNFKFAYEMTFGDGEYSVEVQGTFQNSKLYGNYSIKVMSIDDNINGDSDKHNHMIGHSNMVITATFVNDLAQGTVYRKDSSYIYISQYLNGKIVGNEFKYQWLPNTRPDLNLVLPSLPNMYFNCLSSSWVTVGYPLTLDTVTEHTNGVDFVFTVNNYGGGGSGSKDYVQKTLKYRVDFIPLPVNLSYCDSNYYLRQITHYTPDEQYLLSEWLINSVTQEVMSKHDYWSPSNCHDYKHNHNLGPGSYGNTYQKFGFNYTANVSNNKPLSLIPCNAEHYRSFWFGNTYYDITYGNRGNLRLVMIDDCDNNRDNQTITLKFDYDGNLL